MISIVVAKADGFATEDPLLIVVVAFSVAITDPVELISVARERLAVSNPTVKLRSFMMLAEE